MAYQENVEVYLTLSYKELQGLCRKHRLPDNKSKTELARLLVEFFTRRALLREKKKKKRFLKDQGPPEARRGERRGEDDVSGAKRPAPIPSPKEKAGENRGSQMAGQLGSTNQVLNTSAENVLIDPSNPLMEGLDCSTSESLQTHIKPPLAMGIHESGARPSSGLEHGTSCDGSNLQMLLNKKGTGQNLLSSNTSLETDGIDLPFFKFRNRHSGESSGESGLDVSNENPGEAYPSFQFFVRADEGINLFVDLNSSPSDWVKKLKCEVCIYQNPQKNSWSISNGIKESGKVEEHYKISYPKDKDPSNDISTAQQYELGAKEVCMLSSLKPTVGLDCNSAVSSNRIYENSLAVALANDHDSKELAECLARGNQRVSSLEISCSDMKHGSLICPEGSVEKHGHIFLADNDCHSSLPGGSSLTNLNYTYDSTDNARVDILDPSEHETVEVRHVDSRNRKLCTPGSVPGGACDNRNTLMKTTITNISEGSSHSHLKANRQSDGKKSINLPKDPIGCCSVEKSVYRDAVPVRSNELGTITPLLEQDPFGLPEARSSQLTKSKRVRSSDALEENLREKYCADAARLKDPVQRFRSVKSPAKDRSSDSSGQPRRSTRLVSK